MIKAKPILKNKFWIIENNGERIGTLSKQEDKRYMYCLLYTSPSPRDVEESRMPSSA